MRTASPLIGQLFNTHNPDNAYYVDVDVSSNTHGSYKLEGRILTRNPDQKPSVMVVHGARADYTKADAILLPLHDLGLDILSATVSGHGPAGHQSSQSFSLDDNLIEAAAFSKLLKPTGRTLIGFSMGGTTAVRLLDQHPSAYNKIILFYPAAFPDDAYSVAFGTDAFRQITSTKGAFLGSSFFATLAKFPGKIMLVKGEFDGLDPNEFDRPDSNSVGTVTIDNHEIYSPIPPEVFSKILKLRPDTTYVELPGADHQFAKWFTTHPKDAQIIVDAVYSFMQSD